MLTLARQPLVQFLALGLVIFALDLWLSGRADDPRRIVIDDKKLDELVTIFTEGQGRQPQGAELDALLIKWTQNEILYREAKLLGLDQGDEMIRNRLILKIRNVLFNRITTDLPDEAALKQWFEENRSYYDKPEYYDLDLLQLTDVNEFELAEKARLQLQDQALLEELKSGLRTYRRRPASSLSGVIPAQELNNLISSKNSAWATVTIDNQWHLARISQRYPAVAADFEQMKNKAAKDWQKINTDLQLAEQTKAIADNYSVEITADLTEQKSSAEQIPDSSVSEIIDLKKDYASVAGEQ